MHIFFCIFYFALCLLPCIAFQARANNRPFYTVHVFRRQRRKNERKEQEEAARFACRKKIVSQRGRRRRRPNFWSFVNHFFGEPLFSSQKLLVRRKQKRGSAENNGSRKYAKKSVLFREWPKIRPCEEEGAYNSAQGIFFTEEKSSWERESVCVAVTHTDDELNAMTHSSACNGRGVTFNGGVKYIYCSKV